MAACPECGGGLDAVRLLGNLSGAATCRWCRAEVELHPIARVARDVLFGAGGLGVIVTCTVMFGRTRDPIWLVGGIAGLLAVTLVTMAWLHLTPLVVVVPRGARKPWSRPRPARPGGGPGQRSRGTGS